MQTLKPCASVARRFGTMTAPHGSAHFLTKTLPKVAAEMALSLSTLPPRRDAFAFNLGA
jgi:hypothetical protein